MKFKFIKTGYFKELPIFYFFILEEHKKKVFILRFIRDVSQVKVNGTFALSIELFALEKTKALFITQCFQKNNHESICTKLLML